MSGPLDRAIEMMLKKIEHLRSELATARAAERERCAKVCDAGGDGISAGMCAAIIRALTDD